MSTVTDHVSAGMYGDHLQYIKCVTTSSVHEVWRRYRCKTSSLGPKERLLKRLFELSVRNAAQQTLGIHISSEEIVGLYIDTGFRGPG